MFLHHNSTVTSVSVILFPFKTFSVFFILHATSNLAGKPVFQCKWFILSSCHVSLVSTKIL